MYLSVVTILKMGCWICIINYSDLWIWYPASNSCHTLLRNKTNKYFLYELINLLISLTAHNFKMLTVKLPLMCKWNITCTCRPYHLFLQNYQWSESKRLNWIWVKANLNFAVKYLNSIFCRLTQPFPSQLKSTRRLVHTILKGSLESRR